MKTHDGGGATWAGLWAHFREETYEPFVVDHRVGVCLCHKIVWRERLRLLHRYLAVGAAHWVPFPSMKVWLLRRTGMRIGRGVFVSPGVVIDPLFPELIELDDDVVLGMGCFILTHEYTASHFRVARVTIGEGSVIGARAVVRSGVRIGKRATIGAQSFVNRDVGDDETVAGVPARPVANGQGCGL